MARLNSRASKVGALLIVIECCKWFSLAKLKSVSKMIPHSFLRTTERLQVPVGGAVGKSFPSTSFILKVPPSYGVPAMKDKYYI